MIATRIRVGMLDWDKGWYDEPGCKGDKLRNMNNAGIVSR